MKITCKTEYAEVTLDIAEYVDKYGNAAFTSNTEKNLLALKDVITLCSDKCKEQSEAIYKLKTTF